jgi:hypothetical protein
MPVKRECQQDNDDRTHDDELCVLRNDAPNERRQGLQYFHGSIGAGIAPSRLRQRTVSASQLVSLLMAAGGTLARRKTLNRISTKGKPVGNKPRQLLHLFQQSV